MDDADNRLIAALVQPGETVLHAAPATPAMARSGWFAILYAIPALAIGWLPLHKALGHLGTLGTEQNDTLAFSLFGGFGTLWLLIGLRLLWEPFRRRRLARRVVHVLTDRRFMSIDRGRGRLRHAVDFGDLCEVRVFAPLDRLAFWWRGVPGAQTTRTRAFDGVRDVRQVAEIVAQRTGVPVR